MNYTQWKPLIAMRDGVYVVLARRPAAAFSSGRSEWWAQAHDFARKLNA